MRSHARHTVALAVLAGGALLFTLVTGACGTGRGREREESEAKKVSDEADLTRATSGHAAQGMVASVTGCLEKRSNDYILEKEDSPVVATTGADTPAGTPDAPVVASYRLKAKDETVGPYVGKQVHVNGTLSRTANVKGTRDDDLAEITVSSVTAVADTCRSAIR